MKKAPLLEEVLKYKKEDNLILSMPGNKSGKGFLGDSLGEEFLKYGISLDITEVDPLDNLHNPEGVIEEAQELLRNYYESKKAYFSVNGSTGGNLASIFASFNEGDEVLVERNCHKSIYNGLILRKLKVKYLEGDFHEELGIVLPPTLESIKLAISSSKNLKGVILTYPNYYGIGRKNIEEIIAYIKEENLKIIIDSAHGAHFNANKKLPKCVGKLADYVVLSAHKTLPSLTQGAYLLSNVENDEVEFYLRAFMTTSPSYLLMASLDYGRYYLESYGESAYDKLIGLANEYKEGINSLDGVFILEESHLGTGYSLDHSRYILCLEEGYSGEEFLNLLRKEKIQCEMSFSRGVVLILSPFNNENDFEVLIEGIKKSLKSLKKGEKSLKGKRINILPKKVYEPHEVFKKTGEWVTLEDAVGKVCKEAIVPYPPGIPIICQGEEFSLEIILEIKKLLESGKEVIGVRDNKIKACC